MRIKAPKETNLGMAQAPSPCTYPVVMVAAGGARTQQPFSSFQAQALFDPLRTTILQPNVKALISLHL